MVISRVDKSAFSKVLFGVLVVLFLSFLMPSNLRAANAAEIITVPNSGFEQDLVSGKIPNWGYFTSGIQTGLSLSESIKFAGNRSLMIDKKVTGALGAESMKLAVTPGQSYEAAVKLYVESFTGTPALWIRWYNAAGQPLNSAYVQGHAMDHEGASFTVRLMISKQQKVVSLQIWQGLNDQGVPLYQAMGQEWSGSIKFK
ncbi:hypothetical protein ACFQZT_28810 [Paenibacillus sp. GCM10027628]|uniref:hypothetical protein n=1 Tax=Paenibacillus sp. GCM10027628 TaxID=3273413 RepID=UPI00363BAF82